SKELINKIRVLEDKEQRNKLKCQLPCILFSGTFSQRNKKSLMQHSGLMVVDFDDVPNIVEYKEVLKKNEYFYLIFDSPSANGLKAVVKIPPCNVDEHSKYFKKFTENLDYIDSSGSDASRVCFESYDEDIFI